MSNSGGSSPSVVTLYTDAACTQAATAQQVIDAFSAGGVRLFSQTSEGDEMVATVLSILRPVIPTQNSEGSSSPAVYLLFVAPDTGRIIIIQLME